MLLRPDGTAELLEGHGLLLGLVDDEVRVDQEVVVPPGSVVLLHTGGLVERRGADITHGLERLRSVVESGHRLAVVELVTHVHDALVPSAPDDDAMVLAVAVS